MNGYFFHRYLYNKTQISVISKPNQYWCRY